MRCRRADSSFGPVDTLIQVIRSVGCQDQDAGRLPGMSSTSRQQRKDDMSTRQTFASVPEYLSSLEPVQAKALAKQGARAA